MTSNQIDLRKCNEGDILISTHGAVLEYMRPTNPDRPEGYYDHCVKYLYVNGERCPEGQMGTRINTGHVFRNNRIPETDHDIIRVIPAQSQAELLDIICDEFKRDRNQFFSNPKYWTFNRIKSYMVKLLAQNEVDEHGDLYRKEFKTEADV